MPTYPAINGGVLVQFPATGKVRFSTRVNDMDNGLRYTGYNWASPLRRWPLEYPAITDSERDSILSFYADRDGSLKSFTFVDPWTGDSYANCRFGNQELQWTYVGPNQNRMTVLIEEFKP
jgi:hypothetical protein